MLSFDVQGRNILISWDLCSVKVTMATWVWGDRDEALQFYSNPKHQKAGPTWKGAGVHSGKLQMFPTLTWDILGPSKMVKIKLNWKDDKVIQSGCVDDGDDLFSDRPGTDLRCFRRGNLWGIRWESSPVKRSSSLIHVLSIRLAHFCRQKVSNMATLVDYCWLLVILPSWYSSSIVLKMMFKTTIGYHRSITNCSLEHHLKFHIPPSKVPLKKPSFSTNNRLGDSA